MWSYDPKRSLPLSPFIQRLTSGLAHSGARYFTLSVAIPGRHLSFDVAVTKVRSLLWSVSVVHQGSRGCILFVCKIHLSFLRTTRFHHIIAPVTNIAAGTSPMMAQVNFVVASQRPGPLQGSPIPLMRPTCK